MTRINSSGEIFRGSDGVIVRNERHGKDQPFYRVQGRVGGEALERVVLMNEQKSPPVVLDGLMKILELSRKGTERYVRNEGMIALNGRGKGLGDLVPKLFLELQEKRLLVGMGANFRHEYGQSFEEWGRNSSNWKIAMVASDLASNLYCSTNSDAFLVVDSAIGSEGFGVVRKGLAARIDHWYMRLPRSAKPPFFSIQVIDQQMSDLVTNFESIAGAELEVQPEKTVNRPRFASIFASILRPILRIPYE